MGEPVVHVVDDDPQVRTAIARLLRSHDYQVETYGSPTDFLGRQPKPAIGCVVLDLCMPEMNGLALQKALADSCDNLPIIFVSGEGNIPDSVSAMKAGALDFLTKPFDGPQLIQVVKAALLRSRELQANREALEMDWLAFESLSLRERQVCLLVTKGLLNKQVGGELGTQEKTIKVQRGNVMRKLGVASLADLVLLVERLRSAGRLK